jgi:hypothetical protein
MGKVVGWVPAPKGARCSGGTGPTNDGRSQVAGRTQKYPLPISCVCSRRREYFASWRVVDFCANRFLLSFRSSNEGATPWLRKQRKRKRRRRSSFELQWASQLKVRRLSSAAGHIQPPFACAIGILGGEGGRLDPRHFLIDCECLRTRGPHCTCRPPPLSTLAPSYANRRTVAPPLPIASPGDCPAFGNVVPGFRYRSIRAPRDAPIARCSGPICCGRCLATCRWNRSIDSRVVNPKGLADTSARRRPRCKRRDLGGWRWRGFSWPDGWPSSAWRSNMHKRSFPNPHRHSHRRPSIHRLHTLCLKRPRPPFHQDCQAPFRDLRGSRLRVEVHPARSLALIYGRLRRRRHPTSRKRAKADIALGVTLGTGAAEVTPPIVRAFG